MYTHITERPTTFDNVAHIKREITHQEVLRGDDRLWILGGRLVVRAVEAQAETTVTVAKGFTTDGASVPWWAQVLTGWRPWDEPQRWGAIVHDWMYCMNGRYPLGAEGIVGYLPKVPRRHADRVFRAVLKEAGAGRLRRWTMYAAVRVGGGPAYRADQKAGPTIYREETNDDR